MQIIQLEKKELILSN